MRYLRQQNINRRAPYDQRLYVDMTDSIVMTTTNNVLLPKGTTAERPVAPTNGMVRYNTTLDELEVYQADTWRSLKFKEISPIIQQYLGVIDGLTYYYGPLNSAYDPANISSNVPVTGGEAAGQYGGQNILVYIENVPQLYNVNYVITQNPSATLTTTVQADNGTSILTFTDTSTIPNGALVTGPYIQAGTTATVISDTEVSLLLPINGGNIPVSSSISFTTVTNKPGYYLNFTSDAEYAGMITKPVRVLLGFDH